MQLRAEQLYLLSYKAAELNHTVLGSQDDGSYIKLPSFSALQSQLGEHDSIVTQVCRRCRHACTQPVSLVRRYNTTVYFSTDDNVQPEPPSI